MRPAGIGATLGAGTKRGRLLQVDPAGPTVAFQWNPETLVRSGREPRIDPVHRPSRVEASVWDGYTAWQIDFTLRLDGWPDTSVAPRLTALERMAGQQNTDRRPPLVRLDYSAFSTIRFIIGRLQQQGREIRRPDLAIVRVDMAVTLREWVEPGMLHSPAAQAAPARRSRTVVTSGEPLWTLAQKAYDDPQRWTEIADANGIADPRRVPAGVRLVIP